MFSLVPIKVKLSSGGPTWTGLCAPGRTLKSQGNLCLTLQMLQCPNVGAWALATTKTEWLPECLELTSGLLGTGL